MMQSISQHHFTAILATMASLSMFGCEASPVDGRECAPYDLDVPGRLTVLIPEPLRTAHVVELAWPEQGIRMRVDYADEIVGEQLQINPPFPVFDANWRMTLSGDGPLYELAIASTSTPIAVGCDQLSRYEAALP